TVCRPSAGTCDPAEKCSGTAGRPCPPDTLSGTSTTCRGAAGVCDVAETCDGVNPTCPADKKSTAVCRPAASVCDVPESRDGSSNTCPADAFASSSTVCRPSADSCDPAESCDGSGKCPADVNPAECNEVTDTSYCALPAGSCGGDDGQFRLIYLQNPGDGT